MAKKVTMQQIANYLGVSKFVVSKALSGKGGVSEATKERVLDAAAQLGYFAQRPVSKQMKSEPRRTDSSSSKQSVLVLMPNIRFQTKESLYWGRILDGISAELQKRDIGMAILSEQNAERLTGLINPDGIMGMIGVGEISSAMLLDIRRLGISMVLVDHEDDLIPLDSIFVDNFEAVHRLTKQLLTTGREDIAFLGNIHFSRSFYDRYLGYRAAVEAHYYAKPEHRTQIYPWLERSLLTLEGYERAHFTEQIKQWLVRLKQLPTAIICANDTIALSLMDVLKERGIDVPEQLSITGFDNIEDSYTNELPLTTVHVPKEMLGKKAVERLLNRLQHQDEPIVKLLVKSEIIYRESTSLKLDTAKMHQ
ncbi:LacI family DNA-binding transcriptional regulator [Paenibacillus sp. FSL W7-1287]|uniref:LacI family DNA-binding transcriptional regulator n=1 Tax=Paenibacillus sp. FSL W7-1287 TaxID=2954538 RepID=UPI0030FA88E8